MTGPRTDPKKEFQNAPIDGLKRKATQGASITIATQWGRLILQIGSTAILARLLTPDDYGLVGMVVVITGLADRFKELGLSTATIQRKNITDGQVSALFWINLGVGLVLWLVVVVSSPLIASFFGREELQMIAVALAFTFVIGASSVQHTALLKRDMRFAVIGASDLFSLAFGVTAAIVAALLGASYWAIVVLNVSTELARTTIIWWKSSWWPSRPRRSDGVGEMLKFGGSLSIFDLMNYFARNADNLLIGRVYGATELGFYNKAYTLLLMPLQRINQPIGSVAIPTLSRLQDDDDRYRRYYMTALNLIGYLTMPIVVMLAVLADEVVRIALGTQWLESVPIFRVLAIAGVTQVVSNPNGWLYVSTGRTGRMAIWGLVSRSLIVAAFVVGLQWGVYGVAVAYAIISWVLLIPAFMVATSGSPVSLADIRMATWRPIVVSASIYISGTLIHGLLLEQGVFVRLFGTSLSSGAVAICIILGWKRARQEVLELRAIATDMFRNPNKKTAS